MKPQTQRWRRAAVLDSNGEHTDEGGDCFAACVASLLEVDIEGFPNFLSDVDGKTWWERWLEYLYEKYRCTLLFYEKIDILLPYNQIAWWIAEVNIGTVPHSVLFHQKEFRWDPLPEPYKNEYHLADVKSMVLLCSISSIFDETGDDENDREY